MRVETFGLYSVPAFEERKPETLPGEKSDSNKITVAQGDVLLCKINPRINRAWVVAEPKGHPQIGSTEWIVFSKQEGIASEFLAYFFAQDAFRNYLAGNVSGVGDSLMRVRHAVIEKHPLSLPPSREGADCSEAGRVAVAGVRGGAGHYFTPRPIMRAIVKVMRPERTMRIADPACGTGGFLLDAYEYLVKSNPGLDRKAQRFLNEEAIRDTDIVPSVTRLCAMNLYLHGMGGSDKTLVETADSLARKPAPVDTVLTNPPFGKKISITVINDDGKREMEKIYYERQDFWRHHEQQAA